MIHFHRIKILIFLFFNNFFSNETQHNLRTRITFIADSCSPVDCDIRTIITVDAVTVELRVPIVGDGHTVFRFLVSSDIERREEISMNSGRLHHTILDIQYTGILI